MSETTDVFRDWDAAYVLGALSADDRRTYERHLASCIECRAAVAELAGLPGILGKLPSDDAVAMLSEVDDGPSDDGPFDDAHLAGSAHTPGLVQRLAVTAARRRRRVRFGLIGAAVALVAAVSIGGYALEFAQTPTASSVAMAPLGQHVITASMQVTSKGWGTRFDWSCGYSGNSWKTEEPVSYDLVVTDKSGTQTTVGTWNSAGPKASGLSASSSIPTADIRSIEIRLTGTTKALLWENL